MLVRLLTTEAPPHSSGVETISATHAELDAMSLSLWHFLGQHESIHENQYCQIRVGVAESASLVAVFNAPFHPSPTPSYPFPSTLSDQQPGTSERIRFR